MINPWNMLPDWAAIRGKLRKVELSKNSINKYLYENEEQNEFHKSQFMFDKDIKKTSRIPTPYDDKQFATITSMPTESKRLDFFI